MNIVTHYYKNGKIKQVHWIINNTQIFPPYKKYPLTREQQIEMKLKYG